jgi:hypothetical protein
MFHWYAPASFVFVDSRQTLKVNPEQSEALAARVRILGRVIRRVVDVVVVPTSARPLVALVTSVEGNRGRPVAREVRGRLRIVRVAVEGDEMRVVRPGDVRGCQSDHACG